MSSNSEICPIKQERTVKRFGLSLFRVSMTLGILAGTALPAQAGLVTVTVEPGTTAIIRWDTNGNGVWDTSMTSTDENRDKIVSFSLGSLEEEKKIGTIWIDKNSDGQRIFYEIKLDANGNTLASLEPFTFPSFTATTPLLASIDMVAYRSAGNSLTIGQTFAANNGTIPFPETFAITLKDASSLGSSPDFSRSLVELLPNYTGPVTVYSFDEVSPVPVPAAVWLLGSGLVGLMGVARRKLV